MKHNSYEENAYVWLKRKGLADKYEHAGIYSISIDNQLVYIGKSHNMLKRVAQHYVGIKTQSEKKYRIIAEAKRKGHSVTFDVLYIAKEQNYSAITNEIGIKEGEYIRKHKPILNTQYPTIDNWGKYDVNKVNAREVLNNIL